jgi:hypothetical protein
VKLKVVSIAPGIGEGVSFHRPQPVSGEAQDGSIEPESMAQQPERASLSLSESSCQGVK